MSFSLNLLFSDVAVAVAIVVFLKSLLSSVVFSAYDPGLRILSPNEVMTSASWVHFSTYLGSAGMGDRQLGL